VLYLLPSDLNKLGTIIYESLIKNLPSLRILSKYLDSLLTILSKLNKPVFWITPSGLKISLSNIKYEQIRTSSSLIPYGKPVTISIPTQNLNTRKIKSSFMPNLVYSLDASNIHLLCNKLAGQPLYTIHDCFATTANNMEFIEQEVKETFIKIYFSSGNYLEKLHQNILEQIKSYSAFVSIIDGKEYVTIDNKEILLPTLPQSFTNKKMVDIFIKGIQNSKFFIS
jgi:DNA-directed RNA polymerase